MEEEKDILKKHITQDFTQEIPSFDFTQTVMQKVEDSLATKRVVEPLLSKRTWIISICIGLFIVLSSFGLETQFTTPEWITNLGVKLPSFENYKMTVQLTFVIVAIFLLMTLVDLIYRRKKHLSI